MTHIDVVSCRNLLIYLGPELQQQVLTLFEYALEPDGFLLLGGSEKEVEPDGSAIVRDVSELLSDRALYERMALATNGPASERIVLRLRREPATGGCDRQLHDDTPARRRRNF